VDALIQTHITTLNSAKFLTLPEEPVPELMYADSI
jgi:hypothetical protein